MDDFLVKRSPSVLLIEQTVRFGTRYATYRNHARRAPRGRRFHGLEGKFARGKVAASGQKLTVAASGAWVRFCVCQDFATRTHVRNWLL